ncbi:hypothetical protein M407DRAFT_149684 [Tulasnella calospora MUT 4182]|uniref:Uncharacterized protein n=1 Tax=Tulasnella calospora MUT 4182 TaxID=1051891 RepID=A0A0C3LCN0_9AGAM|nr:hypothetical protein M407DRAFT_149684 [Tulasnella calospora MUT 4182]
MSMDPVGHGLRGEWVEFTRSALRRPTTRPKSLGSDDHRFANERLRTSPSAPSLPTYFNLNCPTSEYIKAFSRTARMLTSPSYEFRLQVSRCVRLAARRLHRLRSLPRQQRYASLLHKKGPQNGIMAARRRRHRRNTPPGRLERQCTGRDVGRDTARSEMV